MKKKLGIILLFILLLNIFAATVSYSDNASGLSKDNIQKIEAYISERMHDGKVPGLAVAIVKDDATIYQNGFGYANINLKTPVTEDTLFEIGSTTKAFTGLGILLLEKNGFISLDDLIKKYVPWFKTRYKGKDVDVSIGQCLYQTSGIPFKTIGNIPAVSDEKALENTVRTTIGQELDFRPGDRFSYATINYDILGLVIQYATGKGYEKYMYENVLKPLDLSSTYLDREKAYSQKNMATGYKVGFLTPREYYAPTYKGDTPAGYVITNIKDITKWMKSQTLSANIPDIYKDVIARSHIPDRSVKPADEGSSYAAGWRFYQSGEGEIAHGGGNPNFSSYIIFRPGEKLGVAVLTNIGGVDEFSRSIGQGIMDILKDRKTFQATSQMVSIDNAAFTVLCISTITILFTIFFIAAFVLDLIGKKRKAESLNQRNLLGILFSIGFIAVSGYCLYIIPRVLYNGLSWKFVDVWAPFSLLPAVIAIFIAAILFIVYFQLIVCFPRQNERPIFPIVVFSLVSGFGNAFIIFVINEVLNRINGIDAKYKIDTGLLLYLFLGIILYVFGARVIRKKMVIIANNLIYTKRMELIDSILGTPFYLFENIEEGKIYAGLNNDTETVSNMPNVVIGALTSIVTLLSCFLYLGTINFYGLLLSIVIIFFAGGIYFVVGKSANKLWERTRDIQNMFFNFINDLTKGFTELSMNSLKRSEFRSDIERSCDEYKHKGAVASIKFNDAFIIGELIFTIVIGMVAFLFPVLFDNVQSDTVRTYIFVFLYMAAPVRGILNNIPQVFRIRISWKRINDLINEVSKVNDKNGFRSSGSMIAAKDECAASSKPISGDGTILRLEGVEYQYNNDEQVFKVGPINLEFKPGEVTFITGGNGSGKTTLFKLIAGLYKPNNGKIIVNNRETECAELGENYSSVFSDYHLFKRLYGVKSEEKIDDINNYLKVLQIDKKVNIENGAFSTISLSSGQRKRLALLVSYLDDREIFLFDEWAADQDPEFKKYFYYSLLQELRNRKKCVIAITHDDHYFHIADKVVKLDMGKIDEISFKDGVGKWTKDI